CLIPFCAHSQARVCSASLCLRHSEGRCSRMRPRMKWRTENSIAQNSRCASAQPLAFDLDGSQIRGRLRLLRMHFDEMIEGEDGKRHPYRGGARCANLQNRKADDSDGEHDL